MDKVREVQIQSAANLLGLIKRIMRYAVNNLHRLIFDENGNVIWPEAAANLASLGITGDEPPETLQIAIIQAIEPIINMKSYDQLDEAILKLNLGTRMVIGMAISAAKTFLGMNKQYIAELVNSWDELMDAVFRDAEFAYLHDVVMQSPNLRKWIQGYVLRKLNITEKDLYAYAKQGGARGNRQVAAREKVQQSAQDQGRAQ